ncbi:MAG: hypothetical protein RR977_02370, partial [Oscillospiraceae bacterium]
MMTAMDDKKYAIDDILLEVNLSSSSQKTNKTDVDVLLAELLAEGISKEIDTESTEPETKEFRCTEAEQPKEKIDLPPKSEPADDAVLEPQMEETGPLDIDVEGIRAENKRPEPKDFSKTEEKGEPAPKEIHFHQAKEETDLDQPLEFAPCFAKFRSYDEETRSGEWKEALQKEASTSFVKGIFLAIFSIASLVLSMIIHLNAINMEGFFPNSPFLLTAGGFGIIAGVLGFSILKSGVRSALKLESNRDIVPTVVYIICMIQYLTELIFPKGLSNANVQMYLPLGILILALGFFARCMTLRTAIRNLHFVQDRSEKYVPQIIWDTRAANEFTKGTVEDSAVPVVNRKTEIIRDFLKLSLSSDSTDKTGRNFTLIGLAIGLAAAVFTFLFTKQRHLAVTILTAITCVFSPGITLFAIAYPLLKNAKLMERVHALTIGENAGLQYAEV